MLGRQRIDLEACGSTNDEAARLARAGASHGTIVVADAQHAGRGREGRPWLSPQGGLYMSAVLRPPLPLRDVPPMTLAIGIAVCDAVRACGAAAELKWPNDLLVDRRKLAGVLLEAQSQGGHTGRLDAVIVGIGVNLVGELPDALHAITLAEAAGREVDREAFLAVLLPQLETWVDRYVANGMPSIIDAWQRRMARGLSARAVVAGAPVVGELAGLDLDGALLLADDAGTMHRVRAGDVEVLRHPAERATGVLSPMA